MHRIALVPYQRNWSYDFTAQALQQHLSHRFEIQTFHNDTISHLAPRELDLLVDFWWRGGLARRFGERVLVQVSSHRWEQQKYGSLTAGNMATSYLRRAGAVLVPSRRLEAEMTAACDRPVVLCPKGFHPETFGDYGSRRGSLSVGWAGKANAPDKNVPLLLEAWADLRITQDLPHERMPEFYNSVDVITCASDAEGDPRPLIEGMACGCFPVVVDVGIVPELVRHGDNGLIVERTPKAFADAFAWCRANLEQVRAAGRRNAEQMLETRTWAKVAPAWGDAFAAAIERAPEWKINARAERVQRIKAALRQRRALRAISR